MFDVEAKYRCLVQLARDHQAAIQESPQKELLQMVREALDEVHRLQCELAHYEGEATTDCPGPESDEWCGGECHSDCPTSNGEHRTIDVEKLTAWEQGLKIAMATLPPPDEPRCLCGGSPRHPSTFHTNTNCPYFSDGGGGDA